MSPNPPSPPPPPRILTQQDLERAYPDNPLLDGIPFTDLAAITGLSTLAIPPLWQPLLHRPVLADPPTAATNTNAAPPISTSSMASSISGAPPARLRRNPPKLHAQDLTRRLAVIAATGDRSPGNAPDEPVDFLDPLLPEYLPPVNPPVPTWIRYCKMLIVRGDWGVSVERKMALIHEVDLTWSETVQNYAHFDLGEVRSVIWPVRPKDGEHYPPELISGILDLRKAADREGLEAYRKFFAHAERMRAYTIATWCDICPSILLSVHPERFIRRWPPALQAKLNALEVEAVTAGATRYRKALISCNEKVSRLINFYASCNLLAGPTAPPAHWWLANWWKVCPHSANVVFPELLQAQLDKVRNTIGMRRDWFWFSRALLFAMFKEHTLATREELGELPSSRYPPKLVEEMVHIWRGRFDIGLQAVEDRLIEALARFRAWQENPRTANIVYGRQFVYTIHNPVLFEIISGVDTCLNIPPPECSPSSASGYGQEDLSDSDSDSSSTSAVSSMSSLDINNNKKSAKSTPRSEVSGPPSPDPNLQEEGEEEEEEEEDSEYLFGNEDGEFDGHDSEAGSDWDPDAKPTKEERRFESQFKEHLFAPIKGVLDLARPTVGGRVVKKRRTLPRRLSTLRMPWWMSEDDDY